MIKKLNFGCGPDKKQSTAEISWINCDIDPRNNPDKVLDFNVFPYPFENDDFDELYCSHIIEHLDNFYVVMLELWRISKNGAKISIKVPYFSNPNKKMEHNPHSDKFQIDTFSALKEKFILKKRRLFLFSAHEFMQSEKFKILDIIINLNQRFYQRFFSYILPCAEIHYLLEVKK